MKRIRNIRNFTLVELLIVISIIAILAAMLLAALNKTKQMGMTIRCAGNIKQLATGWQGYLVDSNGWMIPYRMPTSDASGVIKYNGTFWSKTLAVHVGEKQLANTNYFNPKGVYSCPAFGEKIPYSGYAKKTLYEAGRTDYGMNRYGPGGEPGLGGEVTKIEKVIAPSRLILFGDSITLNFDGRGGCSCILRVSNNDARCIGFRHGSFSNFAFVDGHVDKMSLFSFQPPSNPSVYTLPWGNR